VTSHGRLNVARSPATPSSAESRARESYLSVLVFAAMGRRGGLVCAAILALVSMPACGDGDSASPAAAGAGGRDDGRKEAPCGESAIARLEYPYAPATLVVLFEGQTAFADARGLTLFVEPSFWRTNPLDDKATYPSQILVGMGLDRLSALHSQPMLQKSAVDDDYAYFGGVSVSRIRRDKSGGPETLVPQATTRIVLDGNQLYYETSSAIMRMPKAGGDPELVASSAHSYQFLLSLLGAVDGTVTWFEKDIDGQAQSVFKRLKPGSTAPEVIGTLPPQYVAAYPALTPEGDVFFLAIDTTTPKATSSLQVLRGRATIPELVDEKGLPPLLVDGESLYYRVVGEGIMKRPRAGGPVAVHVPARGSEQISALLPLGSELYSFAETGCVYRGLK
jgi:hypothetical protein